MVHLNIKVIGFVQGVFFRANAKEEALKLRLNGFVQNMSDGSVYIEVEGKKEDLEKFIKWCNSGPSTAQVEKVEVSEGPLKNFQTFKII